MANEIASPVAESKMKVLQLQELDLIDGGMIGAVIESPWSCPSIYCVDDAWSTQSVDCN